MAKYMFLVFTTPQPGQDEAYNRWYDDPHLGDVLNVPGFTAAQRFRLTPQFGAPDIRPYLAIYEIEAEDAEAALMDLSMRADTGAMYISDALDADASMTYLASPLGARVVRPQSKAAE